MKQSQDDLVQLVGVIIHDVLSRPHNYKYADCVTRPVTAYFFPRTGSLASGSSDE
jgi:hypothetical protein